MLKKYLLSAVAIGSLLLLVGAGCNSNSISNNATPGDQVSSQPNADTNNNQVPPAPAATAPAINSSQPTVKKTSDPTPTTPVKEFTLTAKSWEFSPSTITVNKGDVVRMKITSVDVEHGFALNDFNVKVDLQPGQTQTVEFVADKVGTFSFFCNVYCGDGHSGMRGTVVVK